VKKIVTELAVLEIKNGAFHLVERAPGVSVEEIIQKTEGTLIVPDIVPEMVLA
jgi:3-oxoacid CoA-transferase subunit B